MGSSNMEGMPKRKKCKVNNENQNVESDPMIPKRKKSGDIYIENLTDKEPYTKKKRKYEFHQDNVISSSMVLYQENNEKIKAHKAKDTTRLHRDELFTEETPCRENTDLEDGSKERKKKKTKKVCRVQLLDNSLVQDLSTVRTHHTNKKKKGDCFTEGVDERVDQSETAVKKKKKRKYEPHQETDDLAANDASSSVVLYLEENETIQNSHKAKGPKRLHGDEHFSEETTYSKLTDPGGRSAKKKPMKDRGEQRLEDSLVEESLTVENLHAKKKKWKGGGDLQDNGFTEELISQRKSPDGKETSEQVDERVDRSETAVGKTKREDEPHPETDDIAADDGAFASIVPHREQNKMIKKSHEAKDTKKLHGSECFIEETPYRKLICQVGRSEKKPKKDHREKHLDESLVEELSTVAIQHSKRNKKKWKGGGDLQDNGFTEELISQRKSPDGKETSEQVDKRVDQSETAVKKKKKKKREDEPHPETGDISSDRVIASIVLNREQNGKIKKSHKAKGPKGRHGDEGLPEVALYREPADLKDKQSLKKQNNLLENSLVEELFSEAQHAKKKKQKGGGGFQDDGFTEQFFSNRKSPDGSDPPEQVDECLDQVQKPKKKKKRAGEFHHHSDLTVNDASSSVSLRGDEPSRSELNDREDRPSPTKKRKSKKVHLECRIEDSLLEELLDYDVQRTSKKMKQKEGGDESHRQRRFTETTEQVVESVDQAEVRVKKKSKNKHLDRSEETSPILAKKTQTEVDQLLQSRAVECDGNVEDPEQISTSGRSRPHTSASTDTDQNPATQEESKEAQNEGDNRPATSGQNTEKSVVKGRKCKRPFIREQDFKLLEEYIPNLKKQSNNMLRYLISNELERIRIAKQKGIVFHSGTFTIEEDEQIKKNVEKFMSEFGIDSAEMLFHPYKFPEQEKTIKQLKRKFKFLLRIAEGVERTTVQVFNRGISLYENSSAKGWYCKEEVKQLKKYHELHGNNWKTIASLLDRSYFSCKLRCSGLRYDVNHGIWSIEETNRLIAAVKEFVLDGLRREKSNNEESLTVPKKKLYTGIKWSQIAEKVETRRIKLCHYKWVTLVMLRMNHGIHPFKGTLNILNNIRIIKWMHESKVKEKRDIKWDKMGYDIGNIPTFILQRKFKILEQRIKGWKEMRLYEIVDVLYHEKLPELEAKLSDEEEMPIEPEKKEEFLISEIFQEWSEIDEIWINAESKAKVRCEGGEGHPGDPAWSVPSGSQCTDAYV